MPSCSTPTSASGASGPGARDLFARGASRGGDVRPAPRIGGMSELPNVRPATPEAPQQAAGTRRALSAIDLLAFACQLFAFATFAIWGFAAWDFPLNLVFGIGAPVAAILLWALFVSPRAVLMVHPFVRALVELFVYASATIAWWSMDQAWVGLVFGVIAVTCGVIAGRRRLS